MKTQKGPLKQNVSVTTERKQKLPITVVKRLAASSLKRTIVFHKLEKKQVTKKICPSRKHISRLQLDTDV